MRTIQTVLRNRLSLILVATAAIYASPVAAQNTPATDKAPEEASNVVTVEITPAEASTPVGGKLQFKAVAKDAAGQPLPDAAKLWFAAPFDAASADDKGEVSFVEPGEITVGAVVGKKIGYAHVTVAKPHIAAVTVTPLTAPLAVGSSHQMEATPRNASGDPRSDVSLAWSSLDPRVASVDSAGMVRALKPGKTGIRAAGDGATGETVVTVGKSATSGMTLSPVTSVAKTGDVIHFTAKDKKGAAIPFEITWSVEQNGAQIWPDGAFVANLPGSYTVLASVGDRVASASIVVAPRDLLRDLDVVGHVMPKDDQFAEEWVWDHFAYLSALSDKVYIFDIADPAHPQSFEPLKVDARIINDVSVTPDGKIGVLTREGASNRKNGIVFFDASDPAHPKVISEYTATVTGGVHSAYLNSHYAYITDDATGSLRVIDFADVKNPREVARWQVENSGQSQIKVAIPTEEGGGFTMAGRYLHDVQVVDGLAYLAYWRDGAVILDVGNGIKGGTPEHPQLVSNYRFNYDELYGSGWLAGTHAVYRYKNYLFIGDEVFPASFSLASHNRIPVRGIAHILDVSDIEHPREVATYSVPEAGSHNIWVVDDVMYIGYYNGGARVVDVSGELRGELYSQGREIARFWSGDPQGYRTNLPFAWGVYPYKNLIYVNDVHGGLWITKLGKHKPYTQTTAPPQ